MADPTLSTTLSRRAILTRSAAAIPAVALPTTVALPAVAALHLPNPDPDARLFRRIAMAVRLRKEYARACRLRDRLWKAIAKRPDPFGLPTPDHVKWHDIAEAIGDYRVGMGWFDMHRRYAWAVRAAVAEPAYTVRGVHAKLDLAVIAARRGNARIYMYEHYDYAAAAVADLKRIVEQAGRAQGRPA